MGSVEESEELTNDQSSELLDVPELGLPKEILEGQCIRRGLRLVLEEDLDFGIVFALALATDFSMSLVNFFSAGAIYEVSSSS